MFSNTHHLRRAALTALAWGAILVTWSELWFYRVDAAHLFELWGVYAAVAAMIFAGLAAFGLRHRDGLVLAAALFGFAIEGVPVAGLYDSLPFSIVWTSLAWHALVSFGIGLVLYRSVMARAAWMPALALNVALGVALGAWNVYSWTAVEVPGGHEPIYLWQRLTGMPAQFLMGYIVFLLGHLVLDLLSQTATGPVRLPRARSYFWLFTGLAAAFYVLGPLQQHFPAALALLPLAGLCIWGLWRMGHDGPSTVLAALLCPAIPLPRYLLSLALPVACLLTASALGDIRIGIEANVFAILIAGPVSLVLVIRALLRGFSASNR